MTLADLRDYCLAKPHATEDLPFGPDVLVFRVGGKMFALTNVEEVETRVNLKCEPERAVDLRDRYAAVQPGYHMNKRHWNTVALAGDAPAALVRALVDDSYALVAASLPRRDRERLGLA